MGGNLLREATLKQGNPTTTINDHPQYFPTFCSLLFIEFNTSFTNRVISLTSSKYFKIALPCRKSIFNKAIEITSWRSSFPRKWNSPPSRWWNRTRSDYTHPYSPLEVPRHPHTQLEVFSLQLILSAHLRLQFAHRLEGRCIPLLSVDKL